MNLLEMAAYPIDTLGTKKFRWNHELISNDLSPAPTIVIFLVRFLDSLTSQNDARFSSQSFE